MKKHILIFFIFYLCSNAIAQHKLHEEKLTNIVELLNNKNSAGLLDLMSDSCRIGNLPPMDNKIAIPEILSKFKKINSFEIIGDSAVVGGNYLISLSVIYEDGKAGYPTFLFNTSGHLINVGIIKAKLKGNPEKALAQVVNAIIKPDTVRINFQLRNGLIYIPAKLNGKIGFFMFDSGAPVVILRNRYVSEASIKNDVSVDFTGMGGKMDDVKWSTENTLEWGGGQLTGLDAPTARMDDMDLDEDTAIFGLMGYGVLSGYQLTFDYLNQELLLERIDEDGKLSGAGFDKGKLITAFPLRMKRHIPIIDIVLNDKSYPMGIDCGANANLLKSGLIQELAPFIDYEDEYVSIAGVGGLEQNNRTAFLTDAKIGTFKLQDMYTVITDQHIGGGVGNDALPIVGLLGTPFLNQQKTTLNFNKGEISFY